MHWGVADPEGLRRASQLEVPGARHVPHAVEGAAVAPRGAGVPGKPGKHEGAFKQCLYVHSHGLAQKVSSTPSTEVPGKAQHFALHLIVLTFARHVARLGRPHALGLCFEAPGKGVARNVSLQGKIWRASGTCRTMGQWIRWLRAWKRAHTMS